MNIAFIIHNQAETGPYWKVLEQCAAMVRLGHSATIFCTSKTARVRASVHERFADGVRIVEAPDLLWGKLRQGVDLWNALWRCRQLAREHRKQPFDVVHAVDCRPTVIAPALYARKRLGVPLVLAWWDLFGSDSKRFGNLYARTVGRVEGWLETSFRHYADGSVAISNALAERLAGLGIPRESIVVEHLGCDTSGTSIPHTPYAVARQQLAERLPDQTGSTSTLENETIFCFAGTIYDADFALLSAALERLQADGVAYRLLWIGKHIIDPETQTRLRITHLGLVPTMAEVYEYFAAADACLLPMEVNAGNMARFPSKVTDYLNAGSPVVLTPVSDFPAWFSRSEYADIGWMAQSDSPADYAAALRSAIADKPRRAERSAATQAFMRVELDVMAIAERTAAFYEVVRKRSNQATNQVTK
jgi:glycosyltransferase involved in cell wall biosynthesis